MKNRIKLSVLGFALITFISLPLTSCSDDDDTKGVEYAELPSTLIGVYTGLLNYTGSDGEVIVNEEGTATISSTGSKTYTVTFSDGVSQITSLKFIAASGGSFASVGEDGSTAGLNLSASAMDLNLNKGGNSWGFSGTK